MSELVLRLHDAQPPRVVKVAVLPFALGRALGNDLVLEHPDVSARHAVIERTASGLVLRDLGSTNGTRVGGRKLPELRLDCNVTALLGGVQVDFVVADTPLKTRIGALPHHDARRGVLRGVLAVIGAYAAMLGTHALDTYSREWPPERPSELFGKAFSVAVALILVSFVVGLIAKLNHRRYHFAGILATLTVTLAAISVWTQLEGTVVYNLRYVALRVALPDLLLTGGALWSLTRLAGYVFESWTARRRWLVVSSLVLAGYALVRVYSYYEFVEGSRRVRVSVIGYPLRDAAAIGEPVDVLAQSLEKSFMKLEELRKEDLAELAANEELKALERLKRAASGKQKDGAVP